MLSWSSLGQQPLVPNRSSTVPFRRDRDFVHRNILHDIHTKCSEPASRLALVGLGGVGCVYKRHP